MNILKKWNVHFLAKTDPDLPWLFNPTTTTLQVHAGETALAFFTAHNKSDKPIVGLSIY